jgi:hypothetical protein
MTTWTSIWARNACCPGCSIPGGFPSRKLTGGAGPGLGLDADLLVVGMAFLRAANKDGGLALVREGDEGAAQREQELHWLVRRPSRASSRRWCPWGPGPWR